MTPPKARASKGEAAAEQEDRAERSAKVAAQENDSERSADNAAEQEDRAGRRAKPAAESSAEQRIGLHSLKPAPRSRRPRKRVGRGEGSGTGKTAGRGQKGYGSRSGAKRRERFEGGQMPIHMRMRKLRGPHMKKSMPFEPFRTHTQPVNLAELEKRFEAGAQVTLETLRSAGLATRRGVPVKVLAKGKLSKPLTVHAHAFSAAAKSGIEDAGGACHIVES